MDDENQIDWGTHELSVDEGGNRILWMTAAMMIGSAVVIDVVNIVVDLLDLTVILAILALAINSLVSIMAWLGFYLWFKLHEVSWMSPKNLITSLGMGGFELFSEGILPAWTIGVAILIAFTHLEDKIRNKTGKDISITGALGKARGAKSGPPPLPKQPPPLPLKSASSPGKQPAPLPRSPAPMPTKEFVPPKPQTASPPLPKAPTPAPTKARVDAPPVGKIPAQEVEVPGIVRTYHKDLENAMKGVSERKDALQAHASDYRATIEQETKKYGEQAKAGQKYIGGQPPKEE